MIEKLCNKLTKKIRNKMPEIDDERAEIIMYGLQNIIGELPKGIIILLISYFLGIFKLTLMAVLIVAPYRCFSGGVHMKTHIGCIIYTLILYSGSALLGKYIVLTGIAPSKGQARTLVTQGGITLNDNKVSDVSYILCENDFSEGYAILKKGKKVFHKLEK